MMEQLLPPRVASVEAFDDPPTARLFPEEEAVLARAVNKRRREFTTARLCARRAMATLGVPPVPLPRGPHGEPCWPAGLVGGITHCAGYRAAAVALIGDILAVGIDAEPHEPLPDGVLATVSLAEERYQLRELAARAEHRRAARGVTRDAAGEPAVCWDRLLFSAKESVYKAWYPLTGRCLRFEEAMIIVAADSGTFAARLLVAGPVTHGRRVTEFAGRWLVRNGLVLTAVTLPADSATPGTR